MEGSELVAVYYRQEAPSASLSFTVLPGFLFSCVLPPRVLGVVLSKHAGRPLVNRGSAKRPHGFAEAWSLPPGPHVRPICGLPQV